MRRDKARVSKLVRQAKKELVAGNRDDALALLKKALTLDPESEVVTEEILQIESELTAKKKPEPSPARSSSSKPPAPAPAPPSGKKATRPPEATKKPPAAKQQKSKEPPVEDDQTEIQSALRTADTALETGDEKAAREALRKVKALDPNSNEIPSRLRLLSGLSTANKHLDLAMNEASGGNVRKALRRARKIFELTPFLPGLSSLIELLEKQKEEPEPEAPPEEKPSDKPHDAPPGARAKKKRSDRKKRTGSAVAGSDSRGADEYVRKVREKVQISALVEAASLARQGLKSYPGHELLATFVEKFDKMGL